MNVRSALSAALLVAGALLCDCSSSDSGGKGAPSSRAGCNAFCQQEAALACGMPLSECYDLCSASTVPPGCGAADDALQTCESKHVSCDGPGTLKMDLTSCMTEVNAYSACAHGDGGTSG